jgi:hypothetical protein
MKQALLDMVPYAIGYIYILVSGPLLIAPIITRLSDCLRYPIDIKKEVNDDVRKWQAPLLGYLERILYVTSLLMNYGGFIAVWLALKVARAIFDPADTGIFILKSS